MTLIKTDTNFNCVLCVCKKTLSSFRWHLIVKGQQNRIECVTRLGERQSAEAIPWLRHVETRGQIESGVEARGEVLWKHRQVSPVSVRRRQPETGVQGKGHFPDSGRHWGHICGVHVWPGVITNAILSCWFIFKYDRFRLDFAFINNNLLSLRIRISFVPSNNLSWTQIL